MSWKKSRFASSLMSLFGDSALRRASSGARMDEIRQAMLDCLPLAQASDEVARVHVRLMYATDVQSLWFLRSDVMTLLAISIGETAAQDKLASINVLFGDFIKQGKPSGINRPR